MEYVILAAGQGSRFVREGETAPKPMVSILGQPMIERLIKLLLACGGERIHVVTNPEMPTLNKRLAELVEEGLPINFRPIVSDNSFYSLSEACRDVKGRFIAMTTDVIFITEEFRKYAKLVEDAPADEALMALTYYVDDPSPLYAHLSDDGSQVINYRYGGEPFPGKPIVSAGMYGLTPEMLNIAQEGGYPESLSDFQRILAVGSKIKVRPIDVGVAFDVDNGHDRLSAEAFLQEQNGEHYV